MRARTRITWLLLVLSCLVQQVRPDDTVSSATPTVTVTKDTTDVGSTVNTTGPASTNTPETVTLNKTEATTEPTKVPTTLATQSTAAFTDPPTTVKPTTAVQVTVMDVSASPSSGGNTASGIPTVSKPKEEPNTAGSGSSGGGGSPVSGSHGSTASPMSPYTTTQILLLFTSAAPSATQSPIPQAPTTKPENPVNVGTLATTVHLIVTGSTVGTTTLQHDKKKAEESTVVPTSTINPAFSVTSKEPNPTTPGAPIVTTKKQAPPAVVPESTTRATKATRATAATVPQTTPIRATSAAPQPRIFSYSLNNGQQNEEQGGLDKYLMTLCKQLMGNLQDGNCTLLYREHDGKLQFDSVGINGKVKATLAMQHFEEITKKPNDNKTLIAILASCGALLIMIVILAVCASHHRKPYNENQEHLTEELHTVENGYHDNPTLEVMEEVQPEMQEKKVALNGQSNDGWMVPYENMLKEDILDEEDTHL